MSILGPNGSGKSTLMKLFPWKWHFFGQGISVRLFGHENERVGSIPVFPMKVRGCFFSL